MIIKKAIILLMAVVLMGLSSCVKKEPGQETKLNPVTEKLIREKITKILDVDGSSVIQKDFKIESNTVEGDKESIVTTVVIVKGLSTFTLKVTLHYVAMVSNYVYTGYELETLSSMMAEGPTMAQAMAGSEKAMMEQTSFYNLSLSVLSFPLAEFKCLKSELLPENGTFFMTCTQSYRMMETNATGTTVIKATYAYNKGWTYKIDNWSFVAVTSFNDTFDLAFTSTFANPDRWFKPNQTGKLSLKGSLTMTFRDDESITIDNQLSGTLVTEGTTMPLIVEAAKETDFLSRVSPDALKLIFGSDEDAYLLIEAVDGMGHCGAASPPYWSGIDASKNYFVLRSVTKKIIPMMC